MEKYKHILITFIIRNLIKECEHYLSIREIKSNWVNNILYGKYIRDIKDIKQDIEIRIKTDFNIFIMYINSEESFKNYEHSNNLNASINLINHHFYADNKIKSLDIEIIRATLIIIENMITQIKIK